MQKMKVGQKGFSLLELLIALGVFLAVSAIVLSFSYDMTMKQAYVSNRSDMHSSVRAVTEILQQEIGQAGKLSFAGGSTTLTTAVDVVQPDGGYATVTLANANYIFTDGDPNTDGIP